MDVITYPFSSILVMMLRIIPMEDVIVGFLCIDNDVHLSVDKLEGSTQNRAGILSSSTLPEESAIMGVAVNNVITWF